MHKVSHTPQEFRARYNYFNHSTSRYQSLENLIVECNYYLGHPESETHYDLVKSIAQRIMQQSHIYKASQKPDKFREVGYYLDAAWIERHHMEEQMKIFTVP